MEILFWVVLFFILVGVMANAIGGSQKPKRKVDKDSSLSEYGISITMGRSGGPDHLAEWGKKRSGLEKAFKGGKWQEFIDLYHSSEMANHRSWDDNEHLAIAFLMLGEDVQSREVVSTAFDRRNSQVKKYPMVELAETYFKLERYEDAIQTIQNGDLVLMREGHNKDLYYKALVVGAKAFIGLQRYNEAINWLKQGPLRNKTLTPGIANLFEIIAVCYEQIGDLSKALSAYQKVLSVRYDKEIQMKTLELEEGIELLKSEKVNNRRFKT